MNILIIHAHSANRGDEAAVKAMVDELLIYNKKANITIVNNGEVKYPNMPTQIMQIDRFPILGNNLSKIEFMLMWMTSGKFAISKSAKEFISYVKDTDVILHAPGGPSIGDTYLAAENSYLFKLDLIRKMKKKYMFYAPSMGPFNNEKHNKMRLKVLLGASKIVLRDPVSFRYVKEKWPELDIDLAMDSALQHDVDLELNKEKLASYEGLNEFLKKHNKCIGITITDLKWHPVHKNTDVSEKIKNTFKEFISNKISEGYGIVFIPQLYGKRSDVALMNEYMLGENTYIIDDLSDKYDTYFQQYVISKLYAVVGMRYHSNIFSAKMGIPFISISYEQKMKGFMELVKLDEYCIDVFELNMERLESKFEILEKTYDEYASKLSELHSYMKQESYKTTQKVIELLEER